MTKTVGLFVYNNVEVLDFAGPYEVFTSASRVAAKQSGHQAIFNVMTIGASNTVLQARAGLHIVPDFEFHRHPALDIVIIPGGVVDEELKNRQFHDWLVKYAARSSICASVCNGAFLLAKAGLLDGKQAVTHWEDSDDLSTMFPAVNVIQGRRWVDLGDIVTSGGISAGIDMALHLVERVAGRRLAESTARQLEFDWTENPSQSVEST